MKLYLTGTFFLSFYKNGWKMKKVKSDLRVQSSLLPTNESYFTESIDAPGLSLPFPTTASYR